MTSKIAKFLRIFIVAFLVSLFLFNFKIINAKLSFAFNKVFAYFEEEVVTNDYASNPVDPVLLPLSGRRNVVATTQPDLPSEATLVIDKLGITVPLVFDVKNDIDDIYDRLKEGVVSHPLTVQPGQQGVSILLGHSSAYPWDNNPYGSVFALLDKLNTGDRFHVQYSDGQTFYYEMKESLIFNPFDPNDKALQDFESDTTTGVALVSCYPVGSTLRRLAVRAVQI